MIRTAREHGRGLKARFGRLERIKGLLGIEALRAAHRPFTRFWFAWSALVAAGGALTARGWGDADAGSVMLEGALWAAIFGVVPAIGLGLVAGMDDARCCVARDLRLAGVEEVDDVVARMLVSACSAVLLWLAGVAVAMGISLALVALGRVSLWTAASPASSGYSAALTSVAIGTVTLSLLAALSVVVAAALRSSTRAAAEPVKPNETLVFRI